MLHNSPEPRIPEPRRASAADYAVCARIIAAGSKSFHAASWLLPARLRGPAFALYAFCRLSDDSVDGPSARADALGRMRRRLDAVFAGQPGEHPVDRALADTVARFAIPRAPFDALIEGFAWDLAGRSYHSIEDLYAYCARVAGSVGAMMAALMGVRTPELVARACDLGVAMQLTNIARDVGEDAANGRLYLPLDWLAHQRLDPKAWLAAPCDHPAIRAATRRLLDYADNFYVRADAGIARLPAPCRPAIRAARLIYAEIGAGVRAQGGDSVTSRAMTTTQRKLQLAVRAFAGHARPSQAVLHAPVLAQNGFLVEAVLAAPAPVQRLSPWAQADKDWGRVFELFSELEWRHRYGPPEGAMH
jgi:15-cis-phytoene synthase